MKCNYKTVESNGKTFVFVTRGNAKEVTSDEINHFLSEFETPEATSEPKQIIEDNKQSRAMFAKDLRMGLTFCANKYNVSEQQIVEEAKRLLPNARIG